MMEKAGKATFVYVTYIAVPPEKVWDALIDGEATRQYWQHDNVSDWKPGSKWEHRRIDGSGKSDIAGTVVETARPSRLVVTWANPDELTKPGAQSRVTYDIQPHGSGHTRLMVTHDELEPGSKMERGISYGWPLVLSSLKSWLESGKPIPF